MYLLTACVHSSDINDTKIYSMMQSQLPKVSTRLGLVLLESRLGSDSFISENESLGSASITKSLGIKKLGIMYTSR